MHCPVLSLQYRSLASLQAAFMPFLRGGGLFLASAEPMDIGAELFLILELPELPEPVATLARVCWITPGGAQADRRQGFGVEFTGGEQNARLQIEQLLSAAGTSEALNLTL